MNSRPTVFLRRRRGSSNWQIVVRTENGKEKVKSTKTSKRREAEAIRDMVIRKLIEAKENGGGKEIVKKETSFAVRDVVLKYISDHAKLRAKTATVEFYRQRSVPLLKRLGDMKASEVDQDILNRYVDDRKMDINPLTKRNISDTTIRHELNLLAMSYKKALARWGMVAKTPFAGFDFPVRIAARERQVTDEEWHQIMRFLFTPIRLIVDFGLLTGMREENLLGLKRSWVDFKNRLIRIPGDSYKNGRTHIVYLNESAFSILSEAWDGADLWIGTTQDAQTYVFLNSSGNRYTKSGFYSGFRRALTKAGLRNIRPHDLRHTFCTRLAASGATPFDLKNAAGHSDLRSTERYVKMDEERARKIVGLLDKKSDDGSPNKSINEQK
ncbi:MAG: site-specific integrase [Nitrospinota bacterium]|nr:site-specific integrase [Nitrospinota bacterium]